MAEWNTTRHAENVYRSHQIGGVGVTPFEFFRIEKVSAGHTPPLRHNGAIKEKSKGGWGKPGV